MSTLSKSRRKKAAAKKRKNAKSGAPKKKSTKATATAKRDYRKHPKFIRDPIHDIIKVEDERILKILNSEPMQRLKRIKQLGMASVVYPGADHSRFSHSLGVYHLAARLLRQLKVTDKTHRLIVKLAALLHDIGHGPFSHLFEAAMKDYKYLHYDKHEEWSKRIILEHSDLKRVVPQKVRRSICDVISGTFRPSYLNTIVSSQLDVDRFDYMLRDSYMTGVHYGKFDLNWMIRNLSRLQVRVRNEDGRLLRKSVEHIVVDATRGMSCLEDYFIGNFYLYGHVCYHKTVQAAEVLMIKIIHRALICAANRDIKTDFHPVLASIALQKKLNVDEYLQLDDSILMSWLHYWSRESKDSILKDLSQRYLSRNLLKPIWASDIPRNKYRKVHKDLSDLVEGNGFEASYYLAESVPERSAYNNLFFLMEKKKLWDEVYFVDSKGVPRQFTSISDAEYRVSEMIKNLKMDEIYLFVPPELGAQAKEIVKGYRA